MIDTLPTAMITGASSGIGAAFARRLASQGYKVVLVARRRERLEALAVELRKQFPVDAEVLVADLSQTVEVERVTRRIVELKSLDVLVNNAGFGVPGNFADVPLEKHLAMIQVHVLASVVLSHAALPGMMARGHGAIINVSSIGGLIPRPGDTTYCATKAYLIEFSKTLQAELLGSGVRVQALCPGFTQTGFLGTPEYASLGVEAAIPKLLWMSADEVVTESLKALEHNQVVCLPGYKNRLIYLLGRSGLAAVLLKILANSLRRPSPFPAQPRSLRKENQS